MSDTSTPKYPLLEGILAISKLELKARYTMKDAAQIFGVTPRALLDWVAQRKLIKRDLPGHNRFLAIDLEEFLQNSKKDG